MRARRGFTLVEVMLALAILAVALILLVKSVAGNITTASEAFYTGIATDLARGKMYDLEEKLIAEGFQEADQELDGDFSEEGWPRVKWKASIVATELPNFETLMGLKDGENGAGAGTGAGSGSDVPNPDAVKKFNDSALGGMLGMFGGGMGGDSSGMDASATGAFMQGQYGMIQNILKASIRKISLTVTYDTGMREEHFDVVLYVTDVAGMAKTLGPMWKP